MDNMANSKDGYIYLDRSLTEHWIWKTKPFSKGQAWIDLIYLASYRSEEVPYDNTLVRYQRGSIYKSQEELSHRWGWSRKKVNNFLKMLSKESMITFKSTRNGTANGTVISLINYEKYQTKGTVKGTVTEQSWNSDGTVTEHNRSKVNKSISKVKENNMPPAPIEPEDDDDDDYIDPDVGLEMYLRGELKFE